MSYIHQMRNNWTNHVKNRNDHNMKYSTALKDSKCKNSYKKPQVIKQNIEFPI